MVKCHFSHSVLCIYFTFLYSLCLYILVWPIFNEAWDRGRPVFFLPLSFIIQSLIKSCMQENGEGTKKLSSFWFISQLQEISPIFPCFQYSHPQRLSISNHSNVNFIRLCCTWNYSLIIHLLLVYLMYDQSFSPDSYITLTKYMGNLGIGVNDYPQIPQGIRIP